MSKLRWFFLLFAFVACVGRMPFRGTDVAKLQPVELVAVSDADGILKVDTDTGVSGFGATLHHAISDLNHCATGKILLETADYVLVNRYDEALLNVLSDYLRPGCGLCLFSEEIDLKAAAAYLRSNVPKYTILQCRIREPEVQKLISRGEEVCYDS